MSSTLIIANPMPRIAPALKDYPTVLVTDLVEYQGTLKDLTEREYRKLRKSILEHGFFLQIYIWHCIADGKIYILDGHQRKRVFVGEGWIIALPVQYIEADSYEDAKQKLLVITSQYGRVTQEGWDEFTFDLDDKWIAETVHFDALPFVFSPWQPTDAANDPNEEWEGMPEYEQNENGAYKTIKVHFLNEYDYSKFSVLIGQALTEKTLSIWHPKLIRENLKAYRVIDE